MNASQRNAVQRFAIVDRVTEDVQDATQERLPHRYAKWVAEITNVRSAGQPASGIQCDSADRVRVEMAGHFHRDFFLPAGTQFVIHRRQPLGKYRVDDASAHRDHTPSVGIAICEGCQSPHVLSFLLDASLRATPCYLPLASGEQL